jgi:hypothetical protein
MPISIGVDDEVPLLARRAAVRLRRMDGVAVSALQPGDICVIVDHPRVDAEDLWLIGMTTIVIREYDCSRCTHGDMDLKPFYACTGIGDSHISHVCLKKIPPAPMQFEPRDEELTV